jgi:molybdenum cofactor biosynthesis protein B
LTHGLRSPDDAPLPATAAGSVGPIENAMAHPKLPFMPLNIGLLTVSDTRNFDNDGSGDALVQLIEEAGHRLARRELCRDDVYALRHVVSGWIRDPEVQVVVSTGGTGLTARDSTPEALVPLFDRVVTGFGELFRQISHHEVGSSTLQSRAVAGLANRTLVFCLPGSTNACRTAWHGILREQLDASHQPCNFVSLISAREHSADAG